MKLAIMGAGGRMGRALVRVIHEMPECSITGGTEPAGSPYLGADIGEVAGVGQLGVPITTDPLEMFIRSEGVIDFTSPAATVEHAGLAAQARIVHVIGTTGLSPQEDEAVLAASRHAVIVKSGNMSLGVNLLEALAKKAAEVLGPDYDIEILEMHHRMKVDAPSGTALMLGRAAAEGRKIGARRTFRAGPRRPYRRAQARRYRFCHIARRRRDRRSYGDVRRAGRARRAHPSRRATGRFSRAAPSGRRNGARASRPASIRCATCSGFRKRPVRDTDWPLFNSKRRKAEMNNILVLVRHGESEWNKLNLFTGWRDVDLSETGVAEASRAGRLLKAEGAHFDIAFTSALKRAQRTLDLILDELGQTGLETIKDQALNERDYGDLAGLNKDDARAALGRGAGAHLAPLLRHPASRRREPEGHRRARAALLRGANLAAGEGGQERHRRRAWQFAARVGDAARQSQPRGSAKLNLATGAPMIYRLNEDGTAADKRELAA